MHLTVLRTLVMIAEHGTFAAAARELDLSQSAVTLHVQSLEAELGRVLFDRSVRPPVLTDVGAAVVARARDVIALADGMRADILSEGHIAGRLQLGAVGSTLTALLPQALAELRLDHPDLHIEIVSGTSGQLLSMVQRRRLDAAVISDYEDAERTLDWRPFLREELVLIAPPDTVESDVRRLVKQHPFIRYSPTTAVGRTIDLAIRRLKLEPREGMRLDWLEAIEAMVAKGHGVAIVPDRRMRPLEGVRILPLPGPSHHRTLGLIEAVGNPKRRMTDLVFTRILDTCRGVSSRDGAEQDRS
jgi:DNA-binding transcriptional LysR family regulator